MSTDRPEAKKYKNMWVALWPLLFLGLAFTSTRGQSSLTRSMGIQQQLGATIPTQLPFTDEDGRKVKLGDMLTSRPTILVPVFYSCKTGCAILTDNIMKTLAKATQGNILKPGKDMDILMYSIDPVEDAGLARAKKALIFSSLAPPKKNPEEVAAWRIEAEHGWHLLTGSKQSIETLSQAIGLKYSYRTVPDVAHHSTLNLINHPTCTVMLTPDGKISSYTIGNDFQTKEVQSDIETAAKGKIGKRADQSWMFGCLMVDPVTGKNRVAIENVWRLIGVLTLLGLGTSIVTMFVKGNRENNTGGGGLSTR
jgi:protein SCO1/2